MSDDRTETEFERTFYEGIEHVAGMVEQETHKKKPKKREVLARSVAVLAVAGSLVALQGAAHASKTPVSLTGTHRLGLAHQVIPQIVSSAGSNTSAVNARPPSHIQTSLHDLHQLVARLADVDDPPASQKLLALVNEVATPESGSSTESDADWAQRLGQEIVDVSDD